MSMPDLERLADRAERCAQAAKRDGWRTACFVGTVDELEAIAKALRAQAKAKPRLFRQWGGK